VGKTGNLGYYYWSVINDDQTPNWAEINNANTPNWEEIVTF
jgi:hypothetical protein